MKSIKFLTALSLAVALFSSCEKDENNSTVENFNSLTVPSSGYWNGADNSGSFKINGITFSNVYNAAWSSWSGFAYSNLHDFTTEGWTNQYSCYALSESSANTFVLANPYWNYETKKFENNILEFDFVVSNLSFKVTNSTYAALVMKKGNFAGRKFGGDSGNEADWFKLQIIGINSGGTPTDTVTFMLADYTFADNTKDYIVSDWRTVDLSKLGKVKKVKVELISTDNDAKYGLNTPCYFCMDDIKYSKTE